jgi:hypothetical protein
MAKVIEFYVPTNFRTRLKRASRRRRGKIIEFCTQARKHLNDWYKIWRADVVAPARLGGASLPKESSSVTVRPNKVVSIA